MIKINNFWTLNTWFDEFNNWHKKGIFKDILNALSWNSWWTDSEKLEKEQWMEFVQNWHDRDPLFLALWGRPAQRLDVKYYEDPPLDENFKIEWSDSDEDTSKLELDHHISVNRKFYKIWDFKRDFPQWYLWKLGGKYIETEENIQLWQEKVYLIDEWFTNYYLELNREEQYYVYWKDDEEKIL